MTKHHPLPARKRSRSSMMQKGVGDDNNIILQQENDSCSVVMTHCCGFNQKACPCDMLLERVNELEAKRSTRRSYDPLLASIFFRLFVLAMCNQGGSQVANAFLQTSSSQSSAQQARHSRASGGGSSFRIRPSFVSAPSSLSSTPRLNQYNNNLFFGRDTHKIRHGSSSALFDSEMLTTLLTSTTTINVTENKLFHHDNGSVTSLEEKEQHDDKNQHDLSSSPLNGQSASNSSSSSAVPDVPIPTENGGYSHTLASKAKISAANKGNTPWNKGRTRSPEERARIAAGVRAKNRERFLQKIAALNMTEAEWNAQKAEEKRVRQAERDARRTEKGGYRPTNETRQKISRILKEKHARGEVKRSVVHPSKVRRGFTHSEETRRKISESLRKRWATDEDYRQNMVEKNTKSNTREETRRKISESLRQKWQDPEFRQNMMVKITNRASTEHDESHRERISQAMKRKWQDEEYRRKTLESIAKRKKKRRASSPSTTHPTTATKNPVRRVTAKKASPRAVMSRQARPTSSHSSSSSTVKANESRDPYSTISDEADEDHVNRNVKEEMVVIKSATPKSSKIKGVSSIQPVEPTANRKKKKVAKKSKKSSTVSKETTEAKPDGSVSRLREERRDLYDLLYGDEDEGSGSGGGGRDMASNGEKSSRLSGMFELGDENLDTFDPYGLDDF